MRAGARLRVVAAAVATAALAVGCARGEAAPAEQLSGAIEATEEAGSFEFTLDGRGEITRGDTNETLNFISSGEVVFPDRVHMTINIDQRGGGLRSELVQVSGIVYIRPGTPGSKWQRSAEPIELAGFDPLASFDFAELSRTRRASDGGRDIVDGVAVRKIALEPREDFRADVERRLPKGFEGTRLGIANELWYEIESRRIVRFTQRYDYRGTTQGYFETVLEIDGFGTDAEIDEPSGDEVSDEPLVLPTIQPVEGG